MTGSDASGRTGGLKPPPASRDIAPFIEERLAELADLAAARGRRRLAVAIQLAALEAAREAQD